MISGTSSFSNFLISLPSRGAIDCMQKTSLGKGTRFVASFLMLQLLEMPGNLRVLVTFEQTEAIMLLRSPKLG